MPRQYFICETQILKVKRIKICKSNNPAKGGGLNTPQLALGFHTRGHKYQIINNTNCSFNIIL
jgi:hypothetical protein